MDGRRLLLPLGATAFLAACVALYETRVLLQLSGRPDPDADRDFRFPGERTHDPYVTASSAIPAVWTPLGHKLCAQEADDPVPTVSTTYMESEEEEVVE